LVWFIFLIWFLFLFFGFVFGVVVGLGFVVSVLIMVFGFDSQTQNPLCAVFAQRVVAASQGCHTGRNGEDHGGRGQRLLLARDFNRFVEWKASRHIEHALLLVPAGYIPSD
jgi:hypothetical protein